VWPSSKQKYFLICSDTYSFSNTQISHSAYSLMLQSALSYYLHVYQKNTQYIHTFTFWPKLFTHQSNTLQAVSAELHTANTKKQCVLLKGPKIQLQNMTPLRNSLPNDYPPQIYWKVTVETIFEQKYKINYRNRIYVSAFNSGHWQTGL
jgi:hypothetical protein